MRDRLADRDLEIKILHKRMSLRRGQETEPEKTSKITNPCTKCQEKDGLVSDLYQKLRNFLQLQKEFRSSLTINTYLLDNQQRKIREKLK